MIAITYQRELFYWSIVEERFTDFIHYLSGKGIFYLRGTLKNPIGDWTLLWRADLKFSPCLNFTDNYYFTVSKLISFSQKVNTEIQEAYKRRTFFECNIIIGIYIIIFTHTVLQVVAILSDPLLWPLLLKLNRVRFIFSNDSPYAYIHNIYFWLAAAI